jgi:rhodanese-related sulfurtransferase
MNQTTENYQDIFVTELELWRAKGAQLIDVREPFEFARGHVPGAKNIPLDQIADIAPSLAGSIVLICASGGRSSHAAQYLVTLGQTEIANLVGGTFGYAQSGLPLE